MTTARRWRMEKPCVDCPFNKTGPGAALRRTLRKGRMDEIKRGLRAGTGSFMCHKTTRDTGDGSNRYCAGALAYQDRHGVTDNYRRVCERLEYHYDAAKK